MQEFQGPRRIESNSSGGSTILGISAAAGNWDRPIVFCDASPEAPDRHDSEKCEERFEKTTIDLVIGSGTDESANDVLEDLSKGKEYHRSSKVD